MEQNYTTNISDLPPEILEHVLSFLTYPELERIQPTCRSFDVICCHLLSLGLARLGAKVDAIVAGFLAAQWYRQGAISWAGARGSYQRRRLYRGVGSLMILAGLVRTSQACSFQLVRAGEFPPLPAQFLQDVSDDVSYASRRNPLVGRNRLSMLHKAVGNYFEHNVRTVKHLSSLAVFRTVVDVLASLPGEGTLVQTLNGMKYTVSLPRVRIFMPPIDAESGCPRMLLFKLVQLGTHAVSHYVRTDQVVTVEFRPFGLLYTKHVTGVRLEAGCPLVSSLQGLRSVEPSFFCVTFLVPLTSCLDGEDEVEEFSHIFRNCDH